MRKNILAFLFLSMLFNFTSANAFIEINWHLSILGDFTLCPGTSKHFSIWVVSIPGDPTYKWEYKLNETDDWSDIAGSNDIGYSASSVGYYRVTVTNSDSESVEAICKLDFYTSVAITQQPVSGVAYWGDAYKFEVEAVGSNATYQWQKLGAGNLWEDLPGANTNELELTNLTTADCGSYQVVIGGSCGGEISDEVTLNVIAPPPPPVYHTVTPGIWCDYAAGPLTVEEGGHLYAQFRVEDPSLTAADILFLVDGVETAFKASVDGRGGSYILNPVKSDRTVVIAQRQYHVNIPEVDGAVISPAPGTHKVAYGEPFRFTIDLDSNPLRASNSIKVFANGIELTPNETGQTQSLQFTIDAVDGPVTITIEGLDPIANISLTTTLFNIYVSNGILVAESPSAIQLSVYTPTGQLYTVRRIPAGTTRLALPAGMYIVRMGDVIRKVVVD